jgi:GNAT superfamily N-acetyltransferase
MPWNVETYDRRYLEQMCRLYNAETAFEPHIAPMNPQRFIEFIEQRSAFDPAGVFVAIAGGDVVGWVHACVSPGSEPWYDPAVNAARIQMLLFPRDRLDVGNRLVAEATTWLKQREQSQLLAMHCQSGYPFYRGLWLGAEPMGTTSLPHVQLAFDVGGYKNSHESAFFVATMIAEPPEVPTAEPVRFEDVPAIIKHQPMADSWKGFSPQESFAYIGDEQVGHIGWALLPQLAEKLGAPGMSLWTLGVSEKHRRKGIGAALTARAMRTAYRAGARSCSLGTQLWNAPAHRTYAKLGFQPHCILVGRTLDLEKT